MWFALFLACNNSSPDLGPSNQAIDSLKPPEKDPAGMDQNPTEDNVPPSIPTYQEDELITVKGSAVYTGNVKGKIVMEVLQNDSESTHPTLLRQQPLASVGEFELKVPKETEGLTLMIYIDATGNEITDDDPRGYYTFETGTEAINDVVVSILDEKDLLQSKNNAKEDDDSREDDKKKEDDKKPE